MGDGYESEGEKPLLKDRNVVKAKLSGVEETMILTLVSRAGDAASPNPILGDHHAQSILDKIDVDAISPSLFPKDKRYHRWVSVRARELDAWCQKFIDEHAAQPVTVLHLACGLDLRAMRMRIPKGSNIRWFDIDKPEVINLRRRLVPNPEKDETVAWDYNLIGASVLDDQWLENIPSDQPLLVIAEGLFFYLTEKDGTSLLRRLVDHAPSGQVILDVAGTIIYRFQFLMPLLKGTGVKMGWGVDDGEEVAAAHPRLHLAETKFFKDLIPGFLASPPTLGKWTPILSMLPSWKKYTQLLRLTFDHTQSKNEQ
ncbi:S-adenosyl-L-methionine-dependent methyltransferase [Xylariaceae sp. FL1272]|nr:S-adenosyl-L-methionine-dependent methyltransferase [Xylariaceae sp. FL1272]